MLLASIDIEVPLSSEGASTQHLEQYMLARLLSTLAEAGELDYPLRLEHRDRPDFALFMPSATVGIECVQSVPEEWAQILAIRERHYPDAIIYPQKFKPGQTKFTLEERRQVARGEKEGSPWMGRAAEQEWADAQAYCIAQKVEKLRSGNYSAFATNWLLIEDVWAVPVIRRDSRERAALLAASLLSKTPPSFARIYVGSSAWLTRLAPPPVELFAMCDLWN